MQKLILMCGLPGSGKSTIAQQTQQKTKENTIIISRDNLRTMLFGTYENYDFNKDNEALVKRITFGALDVAIEKGFNIIIDETNLTKKKRRSWIINGRLMAEKCGIDLKISCVWVKTSKEECKKRRRIDNKESNNNWDAIIDGMVENWQTPNNDEFDKLFIIEKECKDEGVV